MLKLERLQYMKTEEVSQQNQDCKVATAEVFMKDMKPQIQCFLNTMDPRKRNKNKS